MSWVIKRKRNGIFELLSVTDYSSVYESYTLLYITDEQYSEFIANDNWTPTLFGFTIVSHKGDYTFDKFMMLAKQKFAQSTAQNLGKKVISKVEGTSRLVRTFNRDRIYIARRKGVKTQNETSINSVCIDNHTRDLFFEEIRRKHDWEPFIGKYELVVSDTCFEKWNRLMDKLYLEQVNQ